jgi:hypothetical protein
MPSAFPSFTIVASRGSRSDLSNLPTSLVSRPLRNALTYNGSSWSAPSQIDTTAEGIGLLSCASSSFCIAADTEGKTTIYNGSSWTTPADTTEPEGIGGLSCASSSFCVAIDWSGNALTYNGSTWSTPTNIGSAAAVSCVSSSFCMAVGINGNAHSYNGSAWTTATGVIGPSEGDGLACASSSFCIATENARLRHHLRRTRIGGRWRWE